ncbi:MULTISPECIES: YlmH family RNA-binding protein [Mammaliicoccus]|uniref:RNA-binding protein n=1 Tax=Mammaliicoccus sciuri TaxID=1296 RepID=A0AAW5LFC3_MAMSC|nr:MULTISPECIES: RNA-binding protein [Mammaliicoccus]MBG9209779.1 RNA-binding protein [Mammaliicoccus sciuri]MCD5140493.1 RNA-binding protein [Mammaliicoccus sciuri]MCI8456918.1 RNA-binding protein [Mammaliicoccus sciuri]MCQ9302905.1 RNA-binding protein [Mammaliicoccus sciuri]MDT0701953.1 RNA-binding protein [Mammaliicoccus sciuri]
MDIYQHFRKEEKEIIDLFLNRCEVAERNYQPVLTEFLDPREQFILQTIVGGFDDLNVHYFGGNEASERKRAIVAPDYFEPTKADYEMVLIELNYPSKFVKLTHRNVLGTIMSLGIDRNQLGDIIVNDRIQFVLTKRFESYIMMELTKIKGAGIKLSSIPFQNMIQSSENWQTHDATVSALRLDVIIKHLTNTSRTISKKLIESKRVKVNHREIEQVDFIVEENDLISIKGYGRAMIIQNNGTSKKGKIRIAYRTLFK